MTIYKKFLAVLVILGSVCISCVTHHETAQMVHNSIPERQDFAPKGSVFLESLKNLSAGKREKAILSEFRKGNMPEHLRKLKPIIMEAKKNKKTYRATLWVMPDYLAVGDSLDYARVPMNPITAQRIADHYGFVLPTSKIVDAIYQNAEIKLKPITFRPSTRMVHSSQWLEHNVSIQKQIGGRNSDSLIAGHKKDVVLSNRLTRRKGRVAIYGWHRLSGKAIQPLSTVHGHHYADYSHGVRLIANMMKINGLWYPVADILQDPELAFTISDEGPLSQVRYQTEGISINKNWLSSLDDK